jgi:hypothetical protein
MQQVHALKLSYYDFNNCCKHWVTSKDFGPAYCWDDNQSRPSAVDNVTMPTAPTFSMDNVSIHYPHHTVPADIYLCQLTLSSSIQTMSPSVQTPLIAMLVVWCVQLTPKQTQNKCEGSKGMSYKACIWKAMKADKSRRGLWLGNYT